MHAMQAAGQKVIAACDRLNQKDIFSSEAGL
jgi:hypothetical protein